MRLSVWLSMLVSLRIFIQHSNAHKAAVYGHRDLPARFLIHVMPQTIVNSILRMQLSHVHIAIISPNYNLQMPGRLQYERAANYLHR